MEALTAKDISRIIANSSYNNLFIPEFTWGDLRIDAILIDTAHRWIRGYEIKVNRQDFLKDTKWAEYSMFCSSLCVVCPAGLIQPEEVEKPFGLIWVMPKDKAWDARALEYKKKPINFQKRNSLSWLYTYLRALETEFRRMHFANQQRELLDAQRKIGRTR